MTFCVPSRKGGSRCARSCAQGSSSSLWAIAPGLELLHSSYFPDKSSFPPRNLVWAMPQGHAARSGRARAGSLLLGHGTAQLRHRRSPSNHHTPQNPGWPETLWRDLLASRASAWSVAPASFLLVGSRQSPPPLQRARNILSSSGPTPCGHWSQRGRCDARRMLPLPFCGRQKLW